MHTLPRAPAGPRRKRAEIIQRKAETVTFYATGTLLTEIFMLAVAIHVIFYKGFTQTQKTWYLLTFTAIMVCAGAEYAVHCGRYDPKFAVILTILTVIQFSTAPLLGLFFSGALGVHRNKWFAIGFFLLNLLVESAAAPFKLVFSFDGAGYHRGNYFLIYEIFFVFSLLYLLVHLVIVGRKFSKRDLPTIVMVLVVVVAGIVPMALWQINISYFAIAMGASLCYIYYNDLVQQDIQAALVDNQKKVSDMQLHVISDLANLIESRDFDTGKHIARTSAYVRIIAERARQDGVYADKIDGDFIAHMCATAPLHDIGKIVVPDGILKKPGKLTPEEYKIMKRHAAEGGAVVRKILDGVSDEAYLAFAADVATYHHEKWNGKGYPQGLKGEEIPLSARIMAIADVFDALISERCYKKPFPPEEAFEIIRAEAGEHFDPLLAKVVLDHKEDFIGEEDAAQIAPAPAKQTENTDKENTP